MTDGTDDSQNPSGVGTLALEEIATLKEKGNEAFRRHDYAAAIQWYSEAVRCSAGGSLMALCNRSLARLSSGDCEGALNDAEEALEVLAEHLDGDGGGLHTDAASDPTGKSHTANTCHRDVPHIVIQESSTSLIAALAWYRKGAALLQLDMPVEAIEAYRSGLKHSAPEQRKSFLKNLQDILYKKPSDERVQAWLAQHWSCLIREAESPAMFSSRDGKLLKPVPRPNRLSKEALQQHLRDLPDELTSQLLSAWSHGAYDVMCRLISKGREVHRMAIATARAWAYLGAGNNQQALKDARAATSFGSGSSSGCQWPSAFFVLAAAHEACGQLSQAALAIGTACNLVKNEQQANLEMQDRIIGSLPQEQAAEFRNGGVDALKRFLDDEREQNLPEYLRKRPKYYYYYKYMRKRINEMHPQLPDAVMDKLLTYDAEELDTLLKYPSAAQGQISELLEVLREHGEEQLASYQPKLLSWDDLKSLMGTQAGTETEQISYADHPGPQSRLENSAAASVAVHHQSSSGDRTFVEGGQPFPHASFRDLQHDKNNVLPTSSEADCCAHHDVHAGQAADEATGESFSASRLADQAAMIDLDALD